MAVTAEADDSFVDDGLARRNALVLAVAQALGGANASIIIALGGLTGYYLLGEDKSLATMPVTAMVLGIALGAIPAGNLMRLVGRRAGFIAGAFVGLAGAAIAVWSVAVGSFLMFCAATFLAGVYGAFVHQFRFAAADTASDSFKPKAISWVLAGGVLAGIIGPQTVIHTKDLMQPIMFAGAFVGQGVLCLMTMAVLAFLKIPKPKIERSGGGGRPVLEIMAQRSFVIAATSAICAYALMSLVMTAAPLAMVACGHSEADAALGIQWHVLAMFGPSFFTGTLIARYGKPKVVAAGFLLLGGCAAVALMGLEVAHFWIALVLLGLGWNLAFIGATAMVTETYRSEERNKVQAANDFLVFGFVATASLASGSLLNAFGWETINVLVFPIIGLCCLLLFLVRRPSRAARGVNP
jgi:MFS family permease